MSDWKDRWQKRSFIKELRENTTEDLFDQIVTDFILMSGEINAQRLELMTLKSQPPPKCDCDLKSAFLKGQLYAHAKRNIGEAIAPLFPTPWSANV